MRRARRRRPGCDWWLYEDLQRPLTRLAAAAGYPRDEITVSRITLDDMRKGCWDREARLEDMDVNHVEASLCFPTLPALLRPDVHRGARTRSSRDLCVKAYNDWMVDEWCGESDGRLIPLIIVQLWDAELAAAEVRRNAARGVHAVVLQRDPAVPRPAVDARQGRLLGPVLRARATRPARSSTCTSARRRRCRRRRPTRRPRSARRSRS